MVIRLDEAFSKGSAKILQNKNLVKSLADSIRADVDDNPNFFPRNAVNTFPRMQDAQLAEWFLGELDRMEQEGYEGTKLTSDGSINDWLVKKYISGAHTWEDLTGKLQQQLHNWVNLKKFGLLKPEHQNIPSFNGVLDLGKYMVGHYSNEMKELQNEIKKAALKKKAKSAVIVNNDDYKIYVTLNRAANQLTGANTTWCTTSSATDRHWNSYSDQAMLFQLFPKDAEFVSLEKEGRAHFIEGAERYQFGADSGYSFMDIADHRYPAEKVRERWPYLWDDLKSALRQQGGKLEGIMKALSEDPHMQDPDVKIKTYKIQTEINKLEKFKNRGYFTDEVRPAVEPEQEPELKAAADSGQEQPKLNPPAEGQPQMESIRELARMMLEGKDIDEDSELDVDEELEADAAATGGDLGSMGAGAGPTGGGQYPPGTAPTMPESFNHKGTEIMEEIDKDVAAMLKSLKKYDRLVESCAPVLMARPKPYVEEGWDEDQAKKEKLKAPPEEVNLEEENETAEEFFARGGKKQVGKYNDKEEKKNQGKTFNGTRGSKSDAKTPGKPTKSKAAGLNSHVKEEGNPWENLGKDEKANEKKPGEKTKTHKGGEVTKTEKGLVHKGTYGSDKSKDKVDEGADQEVLDWMKRFASLGNMKGYGR